METAIRSSAAVTEQAQFAAWLAGQVTGALLDEVMLAPKPGLVDPRHRGAHSDMHWQLLSRSAHALRPGFQAMALAAYRQPAGSALRERIGALGREAEAAMLAATGGINTHRGAIWALGLLAVAAAQAPDELTPAAIAARAGSLARMPDRHAPEHTGHPGERACRRYGVGGARGQAQAGFPHVLGHGLPTLRGARAQGATEHAARLDALLAIMATLDDTCVLSRGGPEALQALQAGARRALAHGCATLAGRRELRRLDRELLSRHVSPGGAADLLAASLLLDRISRA
ncbi:triphosphoribosyl-dephospho-CoA synthase [Dyella sp. SG609]|uniref:triphosphoribosyl-dephospho-CoA synthase n=1 Tax=Dyella sp. SG609 TaxID=2587018 RepID=UPI0014469839|nr:triphosphoribosyl-dephospho-CoA synthase [Dyella sp. SG609]NKJ22353.1 triphosphoribosyl-dephospho-CoA synthase [Dyella sp. SG609]